MVELTEKAAQYAAEKSNEVIANALAKAYEDGYRDGYKNREEEIPVDLRDNKTEYVDLGLPSGTLWAKEYEKENGNTLYLPYEKAARLHLPTMVQWEELQKNCRWHGKYNINQEVYSITFVGPNGNSIIFHATGYKKGNQLVNKNYNGDGHVFLWISDEEEKEEKKAIHMGREGEGAMRHTAVCITQIFMGFQLPARLVRMK